MEHEKHIPIKSSRFLRMVLLYQNQSPPRRDGFKIDLLLQQRKESLLPEQQQQLLQFDILVKEKDHHGMVHIDYVPSNYKANVLTTTTMNWRNFLPNNNNGAVWQQFVNCGPNKPWRIGRAISTMDTTTTTWCSFVIRPVARRSWRRYDPRSNRNNSHSRKQLHGKRQLPPKHSCIGNDCRLVYRLVHYVVETITTMMISETLRCNKAVQMRVVGRIGTIYFSTWQMGHEHDVFPSGIRLMFRALCETF